MISPTQHEQGGLWDTPGPAMTTIICSPLQLETASCIENMARLRRARVDLLSWTERSCMSDWLYVTYDFLILPFARNWERLRKSCHEHARTSYSRLFLFGTSSVGDSSTRISTSSVWERSAARLTQAGLTLDMEGIAKDKKRNGGRPSARMYADTTSQSRPGVRAGPFSFEPFRPSGRGRPLLHVL